MLPVAVTALLAVGINAKQSATYNDLPEMIIFQSLSRDLKILM